MLVDFHGWGAHRLHCVIGQHRVVHRRVHELYTRKFKNARRVAKNFELIDEVPDDVQDKADARGLPRAKAASA